MLFERYSQENERTSHRLGENICKSHKDKGLIRRIYKGLSKLDNKKNNHILKMGIIFEKTLHQRRDTGGKEDKKSCWASVVIREIETKTTGKKSLTYLVDWPKFR